jgi:hypothetical protein
MFRFYDTKTGESPVTVAERSEAWTVFARSEAGMNREERGWVCKDGRAGSRP